MLLAFDTSSPTVTVAVHDGTEIRAELRSGETMRHGEQLTPLISAALAAVSSTPRELTGIAVGVGPGPFTGLRVGLVTARTMGHVLGVPIHGVCSLDVLAVEAVDTAAVDTGFVVATDARRREVYLASYDDRGRRVAGPQVRRPADVATEGPVVGEGAALYPESFPDGRAPLRPDAGRLAQCVLDERVEVHPPEPLYLRRPDAAIPRPRRG